MNRIMGRWLKVGVLMLVAAVVFAACEGAAGVKGVAGPAGPKGDPGAAGPMRVHPDRLAILAPMESGDRRGRQGRAEKLDRRGRRGRMDRSVIFLLHGWVRFLTL